MNDNHDKANHLPQSSRLVDVKARGEIGDEVINAVIAAAVWSEGQRPGIWQKMIAAVKRGAAGTEEGTANAFFFQAMVSRLLEEFHDLNT